MWIENVDTEESDLDIDGVRVDVYRNLNNDCLSIVSRDSGDETTEYGTKIGEADMVLIDEPSFVVQDAGRERVRDEERKNVHAFVRGTVEAVDLDAEIEWNLMARMFSNDMCNIGYPEGASRSAEQNIRDGDGPDIAEVTYDPYEMEGFEVIDVVRMEQYDYTEGDVIEEAMTACVTTEGAGVALADREAVEA